MNDWQQVEVHYANANSNSVFSDMCNNALPWEFNFCVLPSALLGSKGKSAAVVVPLSYFQCFEHLPNCPIFIDDILPGLHPSMDIDHEFWSELDVEAARALLIRLGYVESKKLENFMVGIYKNLGAVGNPWRADD